MALEKADSGNILVQNYGRNPAVNFNFMLRVEGIYDLPCKTVRAFKRENEYERIQEGGLNDYVHLRRKPISQPFTFQVERYVGTDILDPLANGTDLILPIILYVSQYGIYNGPFLPIRMYTFTGCTVIAKEYGELNAEQSGLLVETTTIAYREMVCMENVAASFVQNTTWKFDEDKVDGDKNTPRRARRHDNEKSLDDMKEIAEENMWQFDGNSREGNLNRHPPKQKTKSGNYIEKERHLDEAEEAAEKNMWSFNNTDKAGRGSQNAVHPAADADWDLEKAKKAAEANRWPSRRNAVDVVKFLEKRNT